MVEYRRDDIYELRIRYGSVNYRILYLFYERTTAVLSHAITKERDVPQKEIDVAVLQKLTFINDPALHTADLEWQDEEQNN
jgi:phage-related protein